MGLLISQLVFPRGPLFSPRIVQLPIDQFWGFNGTVLYQAQTPQFKLTPGIAVYDLAPSGYPRIDQTWSWTYNLNLIGQDVIPGPPGRAYYDRPPPVNWYREWALNLQQTTLRPFPPGAIVYDLAPRDFQRILENWAWQYNLNLIGQDRLPTGKQITDLPPRSYPRPDETWISVYNLNLIGQDQVPGFRQVYDLPPRSYPRPDETWTNSYNLNLIGADVVPGRQFTDRPPPVQWYRSWELATVLLNTVPPGTLPNLTGQVTDLPPRDYQRIIEGWTNSYNLNLIGKDIVPGQQYTERPPPVNWYREWALNLQQSTLQPIPYGANVYDLPPRDFQRILESWTWAYNLNLIGQDALPVGKQVTELSPKDYQRLFQTWVAFASLALTTTPPGLLPQGASKLSDLPPPDYQRIIESWTWAYNLNLIGKDVVPGQQYTDRPPPVNWYRTWELNPLESVLKNIPPGSIATDLPPRDYQRFVILGAWNYNLNLIGNDVLPPGGRRTTELTPPLPPRIEQTIGLGIALYFPTPTIPPPILNSGIFFNRPPERPLPLPAIAWYNNPILVLQPVFVPSSAKRPLYTVAPNTVITQYWLGRS